MNAVPPALAGVLVGVQLDSVWFDMLQLLIGVPPPVLAFQPQAGLQQSQ